MRTDFDDHPPIGQTTTHMEDAALDRGNAKAKRQRDNWKARAGAACAALRRLVAAASVFQAEQAGATDPRCGMQQPVTVAEADELNEAIREAEVALGKET